MPLLIKRNLDAIPFDPLDPAIDPLPKVWDGPHVSLRISEGFATLRLLPMNGPQAYLLQNEDRRVIFVNPYKDDLALIGTTDIASNGRAEDVAIDGGEVSSLS